MPTDFEAARRDIGHCDNLTGEWRASGASEGREFAVLTDTIHEGTFDLKTAQHKKYKQVDARDSLRDSMTDLELRSSIWRRWRRPRSTASATRGGSPTCGGTRPTRARPAARRVRPSNRAWDGRL